jgi:tetratricopeptide (TPR) repeat protein
MSSAEYAVHKLHLGIAEEGQRLAVAGKYELALERFREALRQAQAFDAPHIFTRHYVQGVVECLEHLGQHQAVVALCSRLLDAQSMAQPESEFQRRDRAALLERIGVAELSAGRSREAAEAFRQAIAVAGTVRQPLSACMVDWLARGLTVTPVRLADVQRRYGYFTLRSDGRFHPVPRKEYS